MTIDVSQFLEVFYEESFEGLDAMESGLLDMQLGEVGGETLNSVFRAAHSIKGGSGTFGLHEISEFTHLLETLLDEMRAGTRRMTSESHATLLGAVDCLREMLLAEQSNSSVDEQKVSLQQQRLQQILNDSDQQPAGEPKDAVAPRAPAAAIWRIVFKPNREMFMSGNDPLRILRELQGLGEMTVVADFSMLPGLDELDVHSCYLSWAIELRGNVQRSAIDELFEWVVDDCELTIDEIDEAPPPPEIQVTAAAVAQERASRDQTPQAKTKTKEGGSIRVSIEKIDSLINIVGELVITQSMLSQFGDNFDAGRQEQLSDGLVQLGRNTRELQEGVLGIRMLPISFAFNRFPRLVHDVSNKLGKHVTLEMSGEHTEVDKTVMEKIGDPLVHLVRNSIDHGIEAPGVRVEAGKPEYGTVRLHAYHRGGNIVIEISDDGAGIDGKKLLAKATAAGLIAEHEPLSDEEALKLVFHPGLSTADDVSDLSGRGVGMDVVRSNIRELGGTVEVVSQLGVGTTFTIRLPLTLAILDGQTIAVGDEIYIVPLVSIIESIQVKRDMLNLVVGKGETFKLRGEFLPIIRLHETFGVENVKARDLCDGILVVVEGDGRRCGLFVDELRGHQQVVIKSLEENYKRVTGISGATILGDGSVALILDLPGLIRLANGKNDVDRLRKTA